MVHICIAGKLADLNGTGYHARRADQTEHNALKLKIKAIEQSEKQLLDTILTGGCNEDLLAIAKQKATQLRRNPLAPYARIEELNTSQETTEAAVHPHTLRAASDQQPQKSTPMIMNHKILIHEDGSTQIIWNR